MFFQKTVSQNLKNTVPISATCTVTAEVLDNNLDSTKSLSLNQIETIEVAPESASNGNGTTTIEISHNNNGNGNVQGGFQLEFVSISQVINHMTSYNSSALIG